MPSFLVENNYQIEAPSATYAVLAVFLHEQEDYTAPMSQVSLAPMLILGNYKPESDPNQWTRLSPPNILVI